MRKWITGIVLAFSVLICSCGGQKNELDPLAGWDTDKQAAEDELTWYFGTNMSENMVHAIQETYAAESGVQIQWINAEKISLKKAFATGMEPDILTLAAYDIDDWEKRLYDLSEEAWVEDVFESSLDVATVGDKLCALPITYEACGILYNKELFEQAGIHELPQTVKELEEICRTLNANGIQPFGECYQLSGFAGHTLSVLFAYEEDREGFVQKLNAGEANITDMQYYAEWGRLFDLMIKYGFGAKSAYYSIDDQIADFAAGHMAMIKQGTWLERLIRQENPEISMGIMAIPCTEDAEDCKLMVTTTNFIGVNANSAKKEQATAFLEWLQNNADLFFGEMEGATLCYYSSKGDSNILNEDVTEYIRENRNFDFFGSEEWPSGYDNDIMRIFQQYLTGAIRKEEMGDKLTEAYMMRTE